ncbi:hypothetical protein ACSLVK_14380 [Photorhabdus tasmaniensis]|uniref:hypothetical protein n=1 Tax=Photorhabdus tasmaniensis TaxID=1004159 RepID=UPI0040418A1E
MGKVTVALFSQLLAAKKPAQTVGGEIISPDLNTQCFVGNNGRAFCLFNNEVEKPDTFTADQFSFFELTGVQNAALMCPEYHWDMSVTVK